MEKSKNEQVNNIVAKTTQEEIVHMLAEVKHMEHFFLTSYEGAYVTIKKNICDYYDVKEKTLDSLLRNNSDEFIEDGIFTLWGQKSIQATLNLKGAFSYWGLSRITQLRLFPPTAVLRIGFFLEQSKTAKELRNKIMKEYPEMRLEKKSTKKKDNKKKKGTYVELSDILDRKLNHYCNKTNKTKKQVIEDLLVNLDCPDFDEICGEMNEIEESDLQK